MKRRNAIILSVVWLLVMVSIAASTVTLLASGGIGARGKEREMLKRYERLESVRRVLSEGYYEEVDDEALMTGAIRGMMAALDDPYTFYYTPEELASHDEQTEGVYEGLGFLIQNNADGYIEILRVYAGGPADAAGAKVGDRIVTVDGAPVSGASARTLNDAVERMRGAAGTAVALTVLRGGERIELNIARGDVSVSQVESAMLPGEIGYIEIFQFGGDDVSGFESALDRLESQGARGLVIDLRNNPGGRLDDVVAIADRLLGECTVVYTQARDGSRADYYSDADCCALPLAVLINGMSASASEILAAAVQDLDRGTIVGERSYGKGIVQTLISFEEDGAGMQYTSAQYFTPSGRNIHGVGVTPDVIVKSDYVNYSGEPDVQSDEQLRSAMAAVRARLE